MSLKIKTTPEIAAKLKDAKTFDARLFQPPHSQADKREMQKLLSVIQNGNRAINEELPKFVDDQEAEKSNS